MNRVRNTFLGFVILIAISLMMSIPSLNVYAEDNNMDKDLKQISCTERTVTVKWISKQGIDKEDPTIKREMISYTLRVYAEVTDIISENFIKVYDKPLINKTFPENGSTEYKTTLTLPTNYWGKACIDLTYDLYKKNAETGQYEFSQKVTDSDVMFCNLKTKPLKPAKGAFGLTDDIESNNLLIKSWIKVNSPRWFYKSEVELYEGNKKELRADISYLGDKKIKLRKGYAYQYRVRYQFGTSSLYSAWSQWKGFVVPKNISFGSKANKKGFTITLGKIAGVSKYTVYTSLKKKAGFKKAKTFKAKAKKKFTVKITKGYKKKKKNYIKLVPYINLNYYKGPSEFQIVTPRALKIYK